MATEIVFSGGERVRIVGTNAETLTRTLNLPAQGPVRTTTGELGPGFVNLQTEDGEIVVNPSQVAYIRDFDEASSAPPSMSGLEPRVAAGRP